MASKIDEEGYFIEDVLLEDDEATPEDCTEGRPPEGFYAPRWALDEDLSEYRWMEGREASEIFEAARASKEAELRTAAGQWYQSSVRGFEGAIVVAKYGRGGLTALGAEERIVFDEMNANYTKLKNLIGQVRAATTVSEVEAIEWP